MSEAAWLGAIGWLDAGGPGTLPYDGGPEDAQGEWNEALTQAATEEVLVAGFDIGDPGIESVIWDASWDAGNEHRGSSRREALGLDSPFSAISVRWREMFPEADSLMTRLRRNGDLIDGPQGVRSTKENALIELRGELWAEIFKHGFNWSADEWWPVSVDVAVSMYEALTVEQMCRLVWCIRWRDVAGATSLLDLVTSHDEKHGHSHFNRLTIRRELDGELRIHIAQLLSPARVASLRERTVSHLTVQRRTGARHRSSRGRATRLRGSRRVTSRSAGGGSSGDSDEPKRAFGPLPGAAAAALFAVAFIGNLKLASAIHWEGMERVLLYLFVLVAAGGTAEAFLSFTERVRGAQSPIRSWQMSPTDPQQALRASLLSAQKSYDADLEAAREARRTAFAKAQAAGMSMREIGEIVGLHHTRVGQIIRGE